MAPAASPTAASTAEKVYSDLLAALQVPRDRLRAIATHLYNELVKGLHADGQTLKMIPSFVHTMPTGGERGTYLALDLGGTNFRVCAVHLKGQSKLEVVADKFTIPEELKVGKSDALFDFIAGAVHQFLVNHAAELPAHSEDGHELQLGFTFSFPVKQTSLASGTLMHWSKGFDCPDAIDQDVVETLQRALTRRGVRVKVVALVNDTVGTLVAHCYMAPTTVMGVIFGTGTNAAYVEHLSQIPKFTTPTESAKRAGNMLINTEWGAFDNERKVLPLTQVDLELDAASSNPGGQTFEKLISGMYLGEITRRALVHLVDAGALFGGKISDHLRAPYAFQTAYMSAIEADVSPALTAVGQILADHFALAATTLTDRQLVKSLVQQIGTRAARLSAVAVFALLEKMSVPREGGDKVTVAIDGSVWLKYPGFQDRLRAALRELMGSEKAALVEIETASDGSGSGAGLIAALAVHHVE